MRWVTQPSRIHHPPSQPQPSQRRYLQPVLWHLLPLLGLQLDVLASRLLHVTQTMGRHSIRRLLSLLLKLLDDHLSLMYGLLQLLSWRIKDMFAQHQIRASMKLQYGDMDTRHSTVRYLNMLQLHRLRQLPLRLLRP